MYPVMQDNIQRCLDTKMNGPAICVSHYQLSVAEIRRQPTQPV